MSKVCICCGGSSIISPPEEQWYFPKSHPIKKSNYWCTNCWYYTELVSKEEFETGYNLNTLLRNSVIRIVDNCRTREECAKRLGVSERSLNRYINTYGCAHRTKRKKKQDAATKQN